MKKVIFVLIILGVVLTGVFYFKKEVSVKPEPVTQTPKQSNETMIVSTKPNPLDETIIPADQIIEITFNKSLQNAPEFKVKIEPKVDFKIELSPDRKTAKITFTKPLDLGASYALSIAPDTKFDGIGEWRQNKEFHFRTITYKGI